MKDDTLINKKTISASSLATYLACPARYKLTYLVSSIEPKPPNALMLAGTGYHAALERAIKLCLEGKEPTIGECVDYGIAKVSSEYKDNGIRLAEHEEHLISPSEIIDAVFSRVKRAATWTLQNRFPLWRPVESEWRFDIPIPDTDWTLTGQIDLIEDDGSVRDFKLSNSQRTPSPDKADKSTQLSMYALARYLTTGNVPPLLTLDYCRDLSRVGCLERTSTRTVKFVENWLDRIKAVCHNLDVAMENDSFPPADGENPFGCNERCDFWHNCKWSLK